MDPMLGSCNLMAFIATTDSARACAFCEQDDLGILTAPGGAKIAWFKDPEGNTASVTQF